MRALLPLLLLAAAPPGAADPIAPAPTLAPDADTRWVSFRLTPGNQIQFDAAVDGRPVVALLDTGASHSLLSAGFASRTDRRIERRGSIAAIGGAVPLGWTGVDSIAFGGLARRGGGLAVVALPAGVSGNAGAIDLLVGRDLLDRFALEIDNAGKRFRLLPSGRLPFAGVQAPLTVGRAPLAYVGELRIAGRVVRRVIVDTGDGTALTLSRAAWRTLPLTPVPVMTTQLAFGVGGQVVADVAILPELRVGQRAVTDVGVWIEPTGGFSDQAQVAGRIGMGLLQRYRVLLDPAAGRMVLGDPSGVAPPPHSTSGLQLGLTRDRLRVLHVMRGGPAEAIGLRVGDQICVVDGVTVAGDPAAAARSDWPYGAPGRDIALTLCGGAERRLTLRRFY